MISHKHFFICSCFGILSLCVAGCRTFNEEPRFTVQNGMYVIADKQLERFASALDEASLPEKEALIDRAYTLADSLTGLVHSGQTLKLFADALAQEYLLPGAHHSDPVTARLILRREAACRNLDPGDYKLIDTKRGILNKTAVGESLADISVEKLESGEIVSLRTLVDRPTLLFLYGSDCRECRKLVADLCREKSLLSAQEEGRVRLISLFVSDGEKEVPDGVVNGLKAWTNCSDYSYALLEGAFGPFPLPCVYVLSSNGIILLSQSRNVRDAMEVLDCAIPSSVRIPLYKDEVFWGGRVADGDKMPFVSGFTATLSENGGNQVEPLLLSSKGRYVWSDEPFDIAMEAGNLVLTSLTSRVETGVVGDNLQDAYRFACRNYFNYNGSLPPDEFYYKPQYNTWIELQYNQNQEDVLRYAEGIIRNGLPPGILMIDDSWMEDYGKWVFHPGRFPNSKAMCDRLHEMGFKIMLWVCPFVSMDQYQIYSQLSSKGALLRTQDGRVYPVEWWNGVSAELDLSNPSAVAWFDEQLRFLMDEYGVDGFKFDAGDFNLWPKDALTYGSETYYELCSDFSAFGARYPYNEFRAAWKGGGLPLVERLHDKSHNWESVQRLIPEMLAANLLGYTFSCPDMVGGGSFASFLPGCPIDQDLIVRSAQTHALMPMMQFSVAPWRILDREHLNAVLESVRIRQSHIAEIVSLMHRAADTGEPVVSPLEYRFPSQGYESVTDEYMLGDNLLVAPMVYPGRERMVKLPRGHWVADDGTAYEGSREYAVSVPLGRLPYFRLVGK